MEEFEDFQSFVDRVRPHGMKSGVIKVKPPKEWFVLINLIIYKGLTLNHRSGTLTSIQEAIKTIKVKNPIQQEFHGTPGAHGKFTQANMEKQRSYNLPEWKRLCEESNHQPPAPRGQRRQNQDPPTRTAASKSKSKPLPMADGEKRRPGRPRVRPIAKASVDNDASDEIIDAPPTPVSPKPDDMAPPKSKSKTKGHKEKEPDDGQEKSVTSRRKNNRREQNEVVNEEDFVGFDYRLHGLEEFTRERCEELEKS
jgi:hypothetical protein